ncbi:hypothetical protein K501DRAFT_266350 [Backusella circina FSU 941]|nr:hypothetical protein K501DRAFT_266350 [Backusella circina FSU 941]
MTKIPNLKEKQVLIFQFIHIKLRKCVHLQRIQAYENVLKKETSSEDSEIELEIEAEANSKAKVELFQLQEENTNQLTDTASRRINSLRSVIINILYDHHIFSSIQPIDALYSREEELSFHFISDYICLDGNRSTPLRWLHQVYDPPIASNQAISD